MKIIYTKHAMEVFVELEDLGWHITKSEIEAVIKKPKWTGKSPHGQATFMKLINRNHILRVVINGEDGIIKVVTFHVTRRGRYESTL